jgi:hypothetical protein
MITTRLNRAQLNRGRRADNTSAKVETLTAGFEAIKGTLTSDQKETRTANTDMMNTAHAKSKLRGLVSAELRRQFGDYSKALSAVLKRHPALQGAKAELANELASLPSPVQFRAEVRREMVAQDTDYLTAFETVCERYPSLRHPTIANEQSPAEADAERDRREALQRYIREYASDFGLDLTKAAHYEQAFRRVLEMHPEIADAMRKPFPANANLWIPRAGDGHTPARHRSLGVPGKYSRGAGGDKFRLAAAE